uniref:transposase family protein n=1 Tax=Rhodoblastus sp. TaxID=1962975 RepID=UPI003F99FF6F
MTEGDAAVGAAKERTVFLSHFEDLPNWQHKGKVAYPLDEVLLVAEPAGAETVADIGRFGRAKLAVLQRFRLFKNGTPSHDQLGIILVRLDPAALQRCFVAWTAAPTKTSAEVIDRSMAKRCGAPTGRRGPMSPSVSSGPSPRASAWCSGRPRSATGPTRSSHSTLLELLAIEDAVVTIDAAGCQRKIAQTIIDKKADYILALKGNQGTLRDDVELFAREQKAVAFKN